MNTQAIAGLASYAHHVNMWAGEGHKRRAMRPLRAGIVALGASLIAGCAGAPPPPAAPAVVPTSAHTLGSGDVVEIKVYREPDLTGIYRVSDSGVIDFPLIGEVALLAKRPQAVEEDIRARLADGFLVNPKVTVFLKERNSKKVYVLGQVNKPGTFNYEAGMTVIQAVTYAGGFTSLASRNNVQLTRVISGREERFRVPVGDIGQGTARNIELQPGDIIFVPEAIF